MQDLLFNKAGIRAQAMPVEDLAPETWRKSSGIPWAKIMFEVVLKVRLTARQLGWIVQHG